MFRVESVKRLFILLVQELNVAERVSDAQELLDLPVLKGIALEDIIHQGFMSGSSLHTPNYSHPPPIQHQNPSAPSILSETSSVNNPQIINQNRMLTASQKQESRMKKASGVLESSLADGMFFKEFDCLQPDNTSITSVLVHGSLEKQSNSGLFFNSRFLFVISPGVIKYRNAEPTDIQLDESNHTKVSWKKEFNVNDIQRCSSQAEKLSIFFKNQREPWVFRAKDNKKAQAWVNRIQKAIKTSKEPKIIINENPLALEESMPPPEPLRQKKVVDNPIIIHPRSTAQIYQEEYNKVLLEYTRQKEEEDRRLAQCKKDPVFNILSQPQDILLAKFQKQAIRYFQRLVDESEVDHQSSLKFDVQFYSSLQKQDFDNLSYLYEKTYNIGILRVIPSILLCYKGVRGLVRHKLPHLKKTNSSSGIIREFQSIQDRTRVQAPSFENSQSGIVLEYYEIDTSMMDSILKLDSDRVFVVNSLMGYIPVGELPITAELLKNKDFLGHVLSQEDSRSEFVKNILDDCKRQLLLKLNTMTYLACNSLQLNKFILKSGLSRFHLSQLYEQSPLDYTKSILLSQMAIMIISQILSENIQSVPSKAKNQLVADLLNLVVGGSHQSKQFWEQLIQEQVEKKFGVIYKQKEINIQYILAGVIEHNGIIINYQSLKENRRDVPSEYISIEDIEGFRVIHRGYSIMFNDKYCGLQELCSDKSEKSFVELVRWLNLKQEPLPEWVVQSPLIEGVMLLLAQHIPPAKYSEPYHHLNIYKKNYFNPVTNHDFQILKAQLRWYYLEGNQTEIQTSFHLFLQKLTFWIGDYSPMHGQLYLYVANLSLQRKSYSDASALIESGILNFIRLDGMFSPKLIQCYVMLGESEQRVDEKVSNYERAKKIYQHHYVEQTLQYLNINFKLSSLYSTQRRYQQSISLYFECINLSEKLGEEEIKVQSFSMLSRCYVSLKDVERHSLLSGHALVLLERMESKEYFSRLLRVCVTTSALKQSEESKVMLREVVKGMDVVESMEEYRVCLEYLMENRGEIESFTECLGSEEYVSSLHEQYQLSRVEPRMMLYNMVQVLGQKVFQ